MMNKRWALLFLVFVFLSAAAFAQTPIRVNAGGPAFSDSAGNTWSADTGFNTGTLFTTPTPIGNTSDQTIYATGRYDSSSAAPTLQYTFAAPNGWYDVRLHFAEPVLAPGQRTFFAQIEGVMRLWHFDVAAEAGIRNALIKTIKTRVTDGQLDLEFFHGVGDPFINGIEILPSSGPTTFTPIRIRSGAASYTDSTGKVWGHDEGYNNSAATFFQAGQNVAGTNDPELYRQGLFDSNRAAPVLEYSFYVPNGVYEVHLHFSEPGLGSGGRQFNVRAEGATIFENLDVAAEAGGTATALIKTFSTYVADQQINLEFVHGLVDNPFINAIEIVATDAPSMPAPLSASVVSGTQINLSWPTSHDDVSVTGYQVERCQGTACTNFVRIASLNASSYIDSGLTPLSPYSYRVRALDGDGHTSVWSPTATATTSSNAPFTPIRVNAGGGAYTDSTQRVWSADTGFNSGVLFTNAPPISGTSDPTLYQTGRFDNSPNAPTLQYNFPVPNGTYDVRLYFAEPGWAPGQRIFKVGVEGSLVFPALDVSAEAGGPDIALLKATTAQVNDGFLSLEFLHGQGTTDTNPFVNAIEVLQLSQLDSLAPSVPAALVGLPISGSQIDLSWAASTDDVGVTAYIVERCTGATCASFAQVASTTEPEFSNIGLLPNTTYRYRVRAVDAVSNYSGFSAISTVATFSNAGDSQAPTVPSGLVANAVSSTQIALSWSASTDDTAVVGYRVERCQGVTCSNFLQIASPAGASYTDTGRLPGAAYRYRVRAVDAVPNYSGYSSVASATTSSGSGDADPPSAPGSVIATGYSANRVDLGWIAATDNTAVAAYFIERCLGASCVNFAQIAALPGITAFNDTGLQPNQTYRYRVRAQDVDGNFGSYSGIVTGTTASGTGTAGASTYQYDSFGRLRQVTVVPQ